MMYLFGDIWCISVVLTLSTKRKTQAQGSCVCVTFDALFITQECRMKDSSLIDFLCKLPMNMAVDQELLLEAVVNEHLPVDFLIKNGDVPWVC